MPSTITDRLYGLTTSVAVKAPCRVATTANITLSGAQTIDGVAVVAGDRVLVKNQTSAIDNGIWVASSGAWTRGGDFDGSLDAVKGTIVYVHSGTVNPDTFWRVASDDELVIGTDAVTFVDTGFGAVSGLATVEDRTWLAGLPTSADAFLIEPGSEGLFVWNAADLSAEVTADSYEGLYVAPTGDTTGATGAWVRVIEGDEYQLSWWGFSEANLATNHLRARSAEALRPDGSTLVFPAGTFTNFGPSVDTNDPVVAMTRPGIWRGQGRATILTPPAAADSNIIGLNTSGCIVEKIRFKDWQPVTGQDSAFCIDIGTRYTSTIGDNDDESLGGDVFGSKVRDCIFENVTGGIRVINALYQEADLSISAYHPRDIEISGNRFENVEYQGISLFARNVRVFNNWLQMGPDGSAAADQACAIRLSGVSHSMVCFNTIRMKLAIPTFRLSGSAENMLPNVAAEFNDPRGLIVSDNEVLNDYNTPFMAVTTFCGTVLCSDNNVTTDVTSTHDEGVAFLVSNGGFDQRSGVLIVDGGHYAGYNRMLQHSAGAFMRFVFRNGSSEGNAAPGPLTGANGLFQCIYVGETGYNALAVEPIRSIEVDNWSHVAPDSFYFAGLIYIDAPANTYASMRNCRLPFGTTNEVVVASGAGTAQASGNVFYPSGHFTLLTAYRTGYSHSPRYMDNSPLGNPAWETYAEAVTAGFLSPSPVDED